MIFFFQKAKQDLEILSRNLLSTANVDSNGLAVFSASVSPSSILDPNVPVDEQIDLLRYDASRWEFPLEAVDFGPVLGQGAFGKVYRATAYGLRTHCAKAYQMIAHVPQRGRGGGRGGGEEDSTGNRSPNGSGEEVEVAVKMLKHYATMEQLKSLLSELKILTYVGAHVNTVNLLGACTSNLIKGELYVLMEYCCYGNLQQYLLKHRRSFEEAAAEAEAEATFASLEDDKKVPESFPRSSFEVVEEPAVVAVEQKGSNFLAYKIITFIFFIFY